MKKYRFDHPEENKHGWYVGVKNDIYRYLHDDLHVKNTTDGDGESSGYFPTKHEAYIAIGKFGRKQMEQAKNDRIDSVDSGSRDVRGGDDSRDLDGTGAMTMQRKLTEKERMHAQSAKEQIAAMYHADSMPDGSYWFRVKNELVDMLHYGTTDGKPYVETETPIPDGYRLAVDSDIDCCNVKWWDASESQWKDCGTWSAGMPFDKGRFYIVPIAPPIPDGYRLAVAGDEGRRDCKMWHDTDCVWRDRAGNNIGNSFSESYQYTVPVDRTPTDEEASRLPTVMVRDYEDRPWENKVLVRVTSIGSFRCLSEGRRNLEDWRICRHLYPGE